MDSYSTRRNRKLPDIDRQNNRSKDFSPTNSAKSFVWLSFQGALEWIHKNEETISKFARLLQIYPNLIQDSSLDNFWEFMEPLLEQKSKNEAKNTIASDRNRKKVNYFNSILSKPSSVKGVPVISLTQTSESPIPVPLIPSRKARTPRVHLLSSSTSTTICPTLTKEFEDGVTLNSNFCHQCVLGLLQEYCYVRLPHPAEKQEEPGLHDNSNAEQQCRLSESDVCVFLFNDSTLNDPRCFHDLYTALALNIPVVYVRHHKQELPKTFTQSVERNSRGCVSLGDYIDRFVLGLPEDGKSAKDKRKNVRQRSKVTPLSIRTRSNSAGDVLNATGYNMKRGGQSRKSTISDTDLLLYLINKFQTSYVFDENELPRCSRLLRYGIYQAIGIAECELPPLIDWSPQNVNGGDNNREESRDPRLPKGPNNKGNNFNATPENFENNNNNNMIKNQSNRLDVPDPDNMLLAREWSCSGSVSAPPRDDPGREGRFNYDFRMASPVSLEMKSTTYLVFDDKKVTKKIRKIHFPLAENQVIEESCETDSDEFDPGGSPIHFPDIDLAREINATMDTSEHE